MASQYRYHKVSPKFWSDRKVLSWDDDTRMLALYLLTCEHRTTEGLFRLPKAYIAADLGWTTERLAEPFAKLLADGFLKYDETVSVMLLTNALKWNPTDNPNQAKAVLKTIDELPETPLLNDFQQLAERFDKRLAEQLSERYGKPPAPSPTPSPIEDEEDKRACAHEEDDHRPPVDSDDPEWTHLFAQIFRTNVNEVVRDEMEQACQDFGVEMVKEAMRRALENAEGPPRQYLRGILEGWREERIFSLERLQEADERRKGYNTRASPRRRPRESAAERLLREEGLLQ